MGFRAKDALVGRIKKRKRKKSETAKKASF